MKKMSKAWLLFTASLMSAGMLSCSEPEVFDQYQRWTEEVAAIDAYLTNNGQTAVKDASGVRMVITDLGEGLPASTLNTVKVDYVGKLFSNGAIFDQGTTTNVLSGYIPGWQIALTTLPEGSKATVYIPSAYAYGHTGQGSIGPDQILVFDVEFEDIVHTTTERERLKTDTVAIDQYLEDKSIEATKDVTGVRYVITEEGDGGTPSLYDKLKLSYKIRLLTNDANVVATVNSEPTDTFDSRTVDFIIGMVVGLQKMREGGKATLYVPSGLAFGTNSVNNNGAQAIPANSNLIIEVELTDIVQ